MHVHKAKWMHACVLIDTCIRMCVYACERTCMHACMRICVAARVSLVVQIPER